MGRRFDPDRAHNGITELTESKGSASIFSKSTVSRYCKHNLSYKLCDMIADPTFLSHSTTLNGLFIRNLVRTKYSSLVIFFLIFQTLFHFLRKIRKQKVESQPIHVV